MSAKGGSKVGRFQAWVPAFVVVTCSLAFGTEAPGQFVPRKVGSGCINGAGPFFLRYGMSEAKHRKAIAKIQDYIWIRWKGHETGCATLRFITLEGRTVDISIFVETNETNQQRVRIERKSYEVSYGKPHNKFIVGATNLAYSISRADEKEFAKGNSREIADSEDLKPGSYVMLFKDKNGEDVYSLEPGNIHN